MKKDKLKLDRFTEITAENFDEFEKVVYEYERWNKKERAVWSILQPVSDLVFFFLMLSGTYMIADRLELPVFSALRPIAEIWGGRGSGQSPGHRPRLYRDGHAFLFRVFVCAPCRPGSGPEIGLALQDSRSCSRQRLGEGGGVAEAF